MLSSQRCRCSHRAVLPSLVRRLQQLVASITRRDLVACAVGVCLTLFMKHVVDNSGSADPKRLPTSNGSALHAITSTIVRLENVPLRSTSHGTTKQQLVEAFAVHPNLAGLSVATMTRRQIIERHVHPSMHEFFYVLQGKLSISVLAFNSTVPKTMQCGVDCLFHAVPGEPHEFAVLAPNDKEDVKMLVIQLVQS
jgi:Cupin domain